MPFQFINGVLSVGVLPAGWLRMSRRWTEIRFRENIDSLLRMKQ